MNAKREFTPDEWQEGKTRPVLAESDVTIVPKEYSDNPEKYNWIPVPPEMGDGWHVAPKKPGSDKDIFIPKEVPRGNVVPPKNDGAVSGN